MLHIRIFNSSLKTFEHYFTWSFSHLSSKCEFGTSIPLMAAFCKPSVPCSSSEHYPFQHSLPYACIFAWSLQPFCSPVAAERDGIRLCGKKMQAAARNCPISPPRGASTILKRGLRGTLLQKGGTMWEAVRSGRKQHWFESKTYCETRHCQKCGHDTCTIIGVFWAVFSNKWDSLSGIVFQHALCTHIPQQLVINLFPIQTSQQAERRSIIFLMKETK